MKKLKKVAGLAIVLAFPSLAITAITVQGEGNRQDSENISEAGEANRNMAKPLRATDIKIHKKVPISASEKARIDGQTKGKPSTPPGKGKNKESQTGTATGILGEAVAGEKYAVVVGICDYPGTANDICLSDGDALNMYNALVGIYAYSPENVILLRDMEATYDNIYNAVSDMKSKAISSEDEVTFFFSGHGTTAKADDGDREKIDEGLVTHDRTNFKYIWDGQLKTWFDEFATSRIAFIFDICKAGGMNDVADNGRVVVMSSAEKGTSFVHSQGENGEGMFSHFFVNRGILQSEADSYNKLDKIDGNVAVEEAFKFSEEKVSYATRNYYQQQVPTIKDLFENDLLLGYYSL